MRRNRENPIRKTTTGKGANYRPKKSGAGMTAKGVRAYRAANPGSKLKTAVTGKEKPGSKAAIDVSRTVQEAQANSDDHLQKHVTILTHEYDKHGEDGNVKCNQKQQ